MKLFPHQQAAVDHFVTQPSAMLADEPGLGKTATLTSLAERLWDGSSNVFVVCPRNVIKHWQRSFETWAPRLWASKAVTITNYEKLKHVQAGLNPGIVIADESHKLKNETSLRFRELWQLCGQWEAAARIRGRQLRTYLATGTPVYSYPLDLMTALLLLRQLDPARIPAFKVRYCDPKRRKVGGGRRVLDLRGASNLDELKRYCDGFILRRTWEAAGIQMPAVTFTDLFVKEKISDPSYHAAAADFVGWYRAQGGSAAGAGLARFTVLRRLLADAKAPAAVEQALDDLKAGQKILIFTGFRETARTIAAGIQAEGGKVQLIMGGQSAAEREILLGDFREGGPSALVATLDSIGEGVDGLQDTCRIAVFVDLDFEPASFVQALRRLWRIGQRHPVVIRRLFVEGDQMEDFVQANLLKKERVQRQLGLEDQSSLSRLRGL